MNYIEFIIAVIIAGILLFRTISIDGRRIAAEARLYLAEKHRDEYKEKWEIGNKNMIQFITDKQRELDALRTKGLEDWKAQKAETEIYMAQCVRYKEELDATKAELEALKSKP